MTTIYCALFVIGTAVGIINAEPPLKFVMENTNLQMEDNPFLGNWEVQLSASGEQMSLKMPIKKDLPDDLRVTLKLAFDGDEVLDMDTLLCDVLENNDIGKDIIKYGLPDGEFPTECPVKANENLEIKDWGLFSETIPPGTPEVSFYFLWTYYEEGKPPILTIEGNGKVTH